MGPGVDPITSTRAKPRRLTWPSSPSRSRIRTTPAILSRSTTRRAWARGAGSTCSAAHSASGSRATSRSATASWSTTYEPGDKLYFFGFSRGAYTARSLAGLVRNSGILRPGHRHRIEEAYDLYREPDKDSAPSGLAAELFRRSHSYSEVDIEFVGVWDTVGSLGIPIDPPCPRC